MDYADDICLMTDNMANAQRLLSSLEKTALQVGLVFNPKKTQFQQWKQQLPLPALNVAGVAIEEVQTYRYLGTQTDTAFDTEERIHASNRAMRLMHTIFRSEFLTKKMRGHLWRTFVSPVLFYALECKIYIKAAGKLSRTMHFQLRRAKKIFWSPGHHIHNQTLRGNLPKIETLLVNGSKRLCKNVADFPDSPLAIALLNLRTPLVEQIVRFAA